MFVSDSQSDILKLDKERFPWSRGRDYGRPVRVLTIERPTGYDFSTKLFDQNEQSSHLGGWKNRGFLSWERVFPCITWMKGYNWKEDFKADVIGGVTVGTMLIPQSMSYAKLAGLHPIYGLYCGFIPVLTYAIFGSSRQLAVGTVAMVSLLVANGLMPIVKSETDNSEDAAKLYVELAIKLAFLVGIVECLMGLVRLGWLIRFISHSVVSGFTTGSAIIIGLSQAKSMLGYEIANSSQFLVIMKSIIDGLDKFKWQPFIMGFTILGVVLTMKHLGKTYKSLRHLRAAGPLSAVVLGTLFVKIFHPSSISVKVVCDKAHTLVELTTAPCIKNDSKQWEKALAEEKVSLFFNETFSSAKASLKEVGEIPQGFPPWSLNISSSYLWRLFPHAVLVSGVGILESVGIAKTLASKNGYELDSNQELFGLGLANLVGSAFSAYPVTGSFSRSAVSNESGSKTGLFGIVVFILIGASLLFLTPLFTDIPQCGLAAIVVSAVMGLIDYEEVMFLWRVEKRDLLLWMATFLFTLFYGIEVGVLVGVGLSLVVVIYESANPHTAVLGRLPGTTVYRNSQQYPGVYTYNGIVIMRVDAPIYFANTSVIKDRLRAFEQDPGNSVRRGVEVDRVHYVIMEMSPVTYIDSSAVHAIRELYYEFKSRGIQLALCNPNPKVMITLSKGGLDELVGHEWLFVRVHDAVQTCISRLQSPTTNLNRASEVSDEPRVELVVDSSENVQESRQGGWGDERTITTPLLRENSQGAAHDKRHDQGVS